MSKDAENVIASIERQDTNTSESVAEQGRRQRERFMELVRERDNIKLKYDISRQHRNNRRLSFKEIKMRARLREIKQELAELNLELGRHPLARLADVGSFDLSDPEHLLAMTLDALDRWTMVALSAGIARDEDLALKKQIRRYFGSHHG